MQICPEFLRGKCEAGVYCRLDHPKNRDQVNSNGHSNPGPVRRGRFHIGVCRHCHHEAKLSTCQECRKPEVGYCSNECRVADLPRHRRHCLDASRKVNGVRDSAPPPFVNPCAPVPRPAPPKDISRHSSPGDHGRNTLEYPSDITPAISATRDSTVFDNHHFYAQRSLDMMVGMPFLELRQRSWLSVRTNPMDVRKLLRDTFRLRKFDNRRHGGKDALILNRGGYADLPAQWNEFVDLCHRSKLLPVSMDVNLVKGSAQTMKDQHDLDAEEIIRIYDDVRMPLQMRIFAEQAMGFPLVPVSEETWADLLKFEQWEWAGNGFEWKVVFGQR